MFIVAVIGSKSSGKTTIVETLVKQLTKEGYNVATVKHIPEKDFSIDTEGKDTWRHAKAGAKKVISIAPNEVAIIHKVKTEKLTLEDIIQHCQEADVVILEGFRKLVGTQPNVFKIITVKNLEEAIEASKTFKPIIAFSGTAAQSLPKDKLNYPVVDALNEAERLVSLVKEKMARTGRKPSEGFELYINGKKVPLKPFVQRIMKSSILAMASNLKGVEVSSDDYVFVKIKKWEFS